MKLTYDQKQKILKLAEKNLSIREIATQVLGKKSRKTTVYDFLKRQKNKPIVKDLKILVLDIETSPCKSWHWKRWKENIGQDQTISESFILTYSAKWLHDDNIMSNYLEHEEVLVENDKRLVDDLHFLLDKADIIIAHNGISFDIPVINTRLIYHKYNPPLPFKIIDTYRIAKSIFRFPSNSLNSLCIYLGLATKIETNGFSLWKGYMEGDKDAINKMIIYNINDVEILEQLYLVLRAWDKKHPNISLNYKDQCPCCESKDILTTDKYVYTTRSKFITYQCNTCGKAFKYKTGIRNINDFTNIV